MRKFRKGWPYRNKQDVGPDGLRKLQRSSYGFTVPGTRVYLERVPLNKHGEDPGGAYWNPGHPHLTAPWWVAYLDDNYSAFFQRAQTRAEAKKKFLACFPGIRFFR